MNNLLRRYVQFPANKGINTTISLVYIFFVICRGTENFIYKNPIFLKKLIYRFGRKIHIANGNDFFIQ
ncbi:hypothetical protein SXCC_04501 [Gluconacetobacter sp. SXCC-1]|nr:hypothetical protein SXCC_04501 [Gluconacetobacter sp. SXCC-1]